jgi:hypothetical protein
VRQLARRRGILTLIATMTETNRDDLEATQPRASDVEHEGGPYRDDLHAAQARVSDLEREAEQLRKRNAELERPEPGPKPTRFAAAMMFATKFALGFAAAAEFGGVHSSIHHTPHPTLALSFLGIAFVCWCCSGFRHPWARR